MAIGKMTPASLQGLNLDQFDKITKDAKAVRDPSLKGKTQMRFTNEKGMESKVRMSEVAAKFVALGKTLTIDDAAKYIEIGKRLQIMEDKAAPTQKGGVLDEIITGIRTAFEKILGNKGKREGRLENYGTGVKMGEGYSKLKDADREVHRERLGKALKELPAAREKIEKRTEERQANLSTHKEKLGKLKEGMVQEVKRREEKSIAVPELQKQIRALQKECFKESGYDLIRLLPANVQREPEILIRGAQALTFIRDKQLKGTTWSDGVTMPTDGKVAKRIAETIFLSKDYSKNPLKLERAWGGFHPSEVNISVDENLAK